MRRLFKNALALAAFLAVCDGVAHAQQAYAPLNLVPTQAEEIGRVPDHFVYLRLDLQVVQDPVDGQLVFLNDAGRVVGRAALPPQFRIGEIVSEAAMVRLLDTTGQNEIPLARTIAPGNTKVLSASRTKAHEQKGRPQLTRVDAKTFSLTGEGKDASKRLNIRSVSGGRLAQANELGSPLSQSRYFVIEEIVASFPRLHIRMFGLRYDQQGRVTGIAYLPIDEMDVVPRDFVTVTNEGNLKIIVPTATGVKIREIQFSSPNGLPKTTGASDADFRAVGTVKDEVTVQVKVSAVVAPVNERASVPRFTLRAPAPAIKRETVLQNARAFLNVNWTMRAENFSKPEVPNRCDPGGGAFWARPTRFVSATIGQTIGPMPYRWGAATPQRSIRTVSNWVLSLGIYARAGTPR